jgi:hypothetical protein
MPDLTSPQIIPYCEESVDMTLFDTKWVPCSTRFVVLGTHLKGTGNFGIRTTVVEETKSLLFGIGSLRVYTLDLEKKGIRLLEEHLTEFPLKCGTFAASSLEERHLATGDFKVRNSSMIARWLLFL